MSYAPPSPTLDVFTAKTNEITQTVDTNKQKITSLETTVTAINDDVTNYLWTQVVLRAIPHHMTL
ncbi:prophage LambdaBa01, minor structural protein [Bacillus cereus]|nr:prophage LambdaBa01, minor structural protein [Bacillus cereus]